MLTPGRPGRQGTARCAIADVRCGTARAMVASPNPARLMQRLNHAPRILDAQGLASNYSDNAMIDVAITESSERSGAGR
jgi:hypothetical protein